MADTGDNMKYRQKKAAEYFVGEAAGNMEKAAVMAGYSKRYARGNAYKIFELAERRKLEAWKNATGLEFKTC